MKITQIRNAMVILEWNDVVLAIDPILCEKESMISLKTKGLLTLNKTNPIVSNPEIIKEKLEKITHILVTHNHFDHIDKEAIEFIKDKKLKVFCSTIDEASFKKQGMDVEVLKLGENSFFDGKIKAIENLHGRGFIKKLMGDGVGYFINIPNQPSIYLSGDTVLTETVKNEIEKMKPKYSILPAGKAQLPVGNPLLFDEKEILEVINMIDGKVILNHMEAWDHCQLNRKHWKKTIKEKNLEEKVFILDDGQEIEVK